jgi:hypothetical protein
LTFHSESAFQIEWKTVGIFEFYDDFVKEEV